MKTSELEKVLRGEISWKDYCTFHTNEKDRLLSRKDGAATSGDINLIFDSGDVIVTSVQVVNLCKKVINNEIGPSDAVFLSSVILLCGFEFENEEAEDTLITLGDLNHLDLGVFQEIQKLLE